MQKEFDLIVIGAGSGGVRAARWAAGLGASVAIVEERFLGGTCVNVGCVPKKLFAYAAELNQESPLAASYGIDISPHLSWQQLRDNKTREIERLNGIYAKLLANAGVTLIEGHARVTAVGESKEVVVGHDIFKADKLLIATGGKPFRPDLPGSELAQISDDLFYLPELPAKAVVVGGGYIACEYAAILNGLGVKTTQLYRGDLILRGFDKDIREFVSRQSKAAGIDLHLNTDLTAIHKENVELTDGSKIETDQVFLATGRQAKLDNLFAEGCEPALTAKGHVAVNDRFETDLSGVFAIGDVVGRKQLTPVALEEGMWVANALYGKETAAMEYNDIATAVFCQPNIATVGLTQEQALEKYKKLRVYKSDFRPLRVSLSKMNHRTLMKLIVDDASDKVVGLHMAGDDAAEIIQGLAVAIKMGATKADFDRTVGIHPTSGEEWVTMRQGEPVTAES